MHYSNWQPPPSAVISQVSVYLPDSIQLIPSIFCSRECCTARHHFRKNTPNTPNNICNNVASWQSIKQSTNQSVLRCTCYK